jgi:hypothetical protein
VPTIRFQVLYVFLLLVLAHERRRIVHFAVMTHPTAEWDRSPTSRSLSLGECTSIYCMIATASSALSSSSSCRRWGIKQVVSAPRSPWQRAYIERVIGSIRRECLDHLIVFSERGLKQ